jgi:hypothetical protein
MGEDGDGETQDRTIVSQERDKEVDANRINE